MQGYDNLRTAAANLGYNETTWNTDSSPLEDNEWTDFSADQQASWNVLGFNQTNWDNCPEDDDDSEGSDDDEEEDSGDEEEAADDDETILKSRRSGGGKARSGRNGRRNRRGRRPARNATRNGRRGGGRLPAFKEGTLDLLFVEEKSSDSDVFQSVT